MAYMVNFIPYLCISIQHSKITHISVFHGIFHIHSCLTWSRSTIGNWTAVVVVIWVTYALHIHMHVVVTYVHTLNLLKSILYTNQYHSMVEKCLELVKGSRGWKWIVLVCFLEFYNTICKYLSNFYDWNIFSNNSC